MATTHELPASLTRNLDVIEDAIRAAVGGRDDAVDGASRYTLGWEDAQGRPATPGAKRIRPALCLLAAEACDAPVESALPGAVAIELVHNFSLVHDDIQDRDHERHGRPTLWIRFGEAQAINAGDFLFTLALSALTSAADVDPALRVRALDVIVSAARRMIRGQWMDLSFETNPAVSAGEYFQMVDGKTGALLGASVEVGAILAGATDETSTALRRWGEALGLAFQAHDDILGIWGTPALTGKSATSDIGRRKRSLPIILAMEDPATREMIEKQFRGAPDVEAVMDALDDCGAQARARDVARDYARRAEELLGAIPISGEHRDELAGVTRYVANRER